MISIYHIFGAFIDWFWTKARAILFQGITEVNGQGMSIFGSLGGGDGRDDFSRQAFYDRFGFVSCCVLFLILSECPLEQIKSKPKKSML